MAYYDHGAAMRKKECADKYAELKKHITSKDENGKLNEWFLAHEHIVDLESKLQQQEKQIEEYRSFFSLMRKLLPRVSSINDVIG
jgi:chromosome segregation ATPase